jgi:hypothetical protein
MEEIMRNTLAIGILLAALTCVGSAQLSAQNSAPGDWQKILIPYGETVYDSVNNVVWLADANLADKRLPQNKNLRFGLPLCDVPDPAPENPCVNESGSMNYTSAVAWVGGMNKAKYLGQSNWQLPTTPTLDRGCAEKGYYGNNFGFDCKLNAMGYLFYEALGFKAPNTAVPMPPNTVGPFNNFQPSLYWSNMPGGATTGGFAVFSFATGAQGGSTQSDYLYLMPMVQGDPFGTPPPDSNALYVNPGSPTVYDPETGVTWLADANLAATERFGLKRCKTPSSPSPCVAKDGSMNYDSAVVFIANMNAHDHGAGYLGQTNWTFPQVHPSCPTYNCGGDLNPMGNLYYDQLYYDGKLGFPAGTPIVEAPDIAVGPFNHLQPSQYWSCMADNIQDACEAGGVGPGDAEFGFSFGDGFLGTTGQPADHFVTAYYVVTVPPTKPPIPPKCPPDDPSCYQ